MWPMTKQYLWRLVEIIIPETNTAKTQALMIFICVGSIQIDLGGKAQSGSQEVFSLSSNGVWNNLPRPTLAGPSGLNLCHPHRYESRHRYSCLSNFCWEIAQKWIILDPVVFVSEKKYDSIKTFPEELNYCISSTIGFFDYFLSELINIQGILISTPPPNVALLYLSYNLWVT